ncbi:hypothetical protein PBCV1_a206L [Paramecium bursaria Chlorella virus 1]|uniref:Uncharacterized protein n=1 Tax=Paramecium bursaria Chlorella virus 1 TaxID=10506 RepID=Q84526_PBCV1|nr:hypothetical protein PBCV1_a206L [Paramecium bursaria Chlorella virus 1]AAC96574.1 hypothetical protein [Paramecium bursaria Chlorella virus 1]
MWNSLPDRTDNIFPASFPVVNNTTSAVFFSRVCSVEFMGKLDIWRSNALWRLSRRYRSCWSLGSWRLFPRGHCSWGYLSTSFLNR